MRSLVPILFVVLGITGCGAATPPGEATPPSAEPLADKPVVPNTDAKVGDTTVCPYSGAKFVVDDRSPRFEYQGKSYVLCSERALKAVQADPDKYLAK